MTKKILIVEDNEDLNNLYQVVFGSSNYDFRLAFNWEEAIEILKIFKPDFILLDLMMPEMNWFEFLSNFKKK